MWILLHHQHRLKASQLRNLTTASLICILPFSSIALDSFRECFASSLLAQVAPYKRFIKPNLNKKNEVL